LAEEEDALLHPHAKQAARMGSLPIQAKGFQAKNEPSSIVFSSSSNCLKVMDI
jgi:hypothetical protein